MTCNRPKRPRITPALSLVLVLLGAVIGHTARAHPQDEERTPLYSDSVKLTKTELLCGGSGPATLLYGARDTDFTVTAAFKHRTHTAFSKVFTVTLGQADFGCRAVTIGRDGAGEIGDLGKARKNLWVEQNTDITRREENPDERGERWRKKRDEAELQEARVETLLFLKDAALYAHPQLHCHPLEPLTVRVSVFMHAAADPFTIPEQVIAEMMKKGAGPLTPAFDYLAEKMMSRESVKALIGENSMTLAPGSNLVPLKRNGDFTGYVELEYTALAPLSADLACGGGDNGPPVRDEIEVCRQHWNKRHPDDEVGRGEVRVLDYDNDGTKERVIFVDCPDPCIEFPGETRAGPGDARGQCRDDSGKPRMSCEQWRTFQRWIENNPNKPIPSGWEGMLPPKRACDQPGRDAGDQETGAAPSAETLGEMAARFEQTDKTRVTRPRSQYERDPGESAAGRAEEATRGRRDRTDQDEDRPGSTTRPADGQGQDGRARRDERAQQPYPAGRYRVVEDGCNWSDTIRLSSGLLRGAQQDRTTSPNQPLTLRVGNKTISLERTEATTARGTWPGTDARMRVRGREAGVIEIDARGQDWQCTSVYRKQ